MPYVHRQDGTKSICWTCKKSCTAKEDQSCCWCNKQEPVPGWDAIKRKHSGNYKHEVSYTVRYCPGYERSENNNLSELANNDACITLAEAILARLGEDYKRDLLYFNAHPNSFAKEAVKSTEHEIRSSVMRALLPGSITPDEYINTMRNRYLTAEAKHYLNWRLPSFQSKHGA